MSEQSTPGPWKIDHRTPTRVHKADEPNRGICTTGGYQTNVQDTIEENISNARLIAAAPDLLDACEQAERLLAKQLDEANQALTVMPHPTYEPGPILLALRAALAKAQPQALANESECEL